MLGNFLFSMQLHWAHFRWEYKMNELVNNLLLAGDKFMSEMHLIQPGFTSSACGSFTKNKERALYF